MNGEKIYIPQFKFFFVWSSFGSYLGDIKCYSLEEAKRIIKERTDSEIKSKYYI